MSREDPFSAFTSSVNRPSPLQSNYTKESDFLQIEREKDLKTNSEQQASARRLKEE